MIRTVYSLLFLAAMAALTCAAADDAKTVEEAERNWAKGIITQDFALLDKVLADDLIYTHSTGARDTKKSYIESLKSGVQKYMAMDFVELNVHLLGKEAAYVVAKTKVKASTKGVPTEASLVILHVYQKRNGRWQLLAHQSARLPS